MYGFIGGGLQNSVDGQFTVAGGGFQNHAFANYNNVGGGFMNENFARFAAVPGGARNTARGRFSLAVGMLSEPSAFDSPNDKLCHFLTSVGWLSLSYVTISCAGARADAMQDFSAAFAFSGETCTWIRRYFAGTIWPPRPGKTTKSKSRPLIELVLMGLFLWNDAGATRTQYSMAFCADSFKFNDYELLDLFDRRRADEATHEDLEKVGLEKSRHPLARIIAALARYSIGRILCKGCRGTKKHHCSSAEAARRNRKYHGRTRHRAVSLRMNP